MMPVAGSHGAGSRAEGSARQRVTEGGGTAPQSLSRQRPKESDPFLNAPLWPEVPGGIAKLGGPDFRELWEVGECGVGNAL